MYEFLIRHRIGDFPSQSNFAESALLNHMGELVGEQSPTHVRLWRKLAGAEHDVLP